MRTIVLLDLGEGAAVWSVHASVCLSGLGHDAKRCGLLV